MYINVYVYVNKYVKTLKDYNQKLLVPSCVRDRTSFDGKKHNMQEARRGFKYGFLKSSELHRRDICKSREI